MHRSHWNGNHSISLELLNAQESLERDHSISLELLNAQESLERDEQDLPTEPEQKKLTLLFTNGN
jgi:hypothetical protein